MGKREKKDMKFNFSKLYISERSIAIFITPVYFWHYTIKIRHVYFPRNSKFIKIENVLIIFYMNIQWFKKAIQE
jgi:hypothetical protein